MAVRKYRVVDMRTETFVALDEIQREIIEWQTRNFGEVPQYHTLLGMTEEMGELAHAILKQEQGIRGSFEEHEAAAKDAIGDWCVYAMAFCARRGWSFADLITDTWEHVQQRDWKSDPTRGVVG